MVHLVVIADHISRFGCPFAKHPKSYSVEEASPREPDSNKGAPLDVPNHEFATFIFQVEHILLEFVVPGIHEHNEIFLCEMIDQSKDGVHMVEHIVPVTYCRKFSSIVKINHLS